MQNRCRENPLEISVKISYEVYIILHGWYKEVEPKMRVKAFHRFQ